jgi:flavin reductase (DIM6/NTAB) family NADH-FMN oxidoreductase RutF
VSITAEEFRRVMREWASGVSIVTTRRPGGIRGITVSSFCSLSLEPPLVLVCIARNAKSHALIAEQGAFAVNVLRADQRDLSERAASRSGEGAAWLEDVAWTAEATGAPRLADCLAWIDCRIVARHEEGDHTIFVGRVEAAGAAGSGDPLLYFRGAYHDPARKPRGARSAAPRRSRR